MIGTLQQIFMVSAVWSLLVTLFAGIAFIIMKDKYQLRNKKDKEEKEKRKKMVKITRIIFFSVGIAKYNKTECIKWVYALDRAIQTDIVDDPRWSEYAQTEIDLRDNDSIERAMDIFYAYVLSFIKSKERQL